MDLRRSQFDRRQAQIWARLCSRIGGQVVAGKWKGDKVQARVDDWIITLDTVSQSNGYRDTSYTRLRAPFFNPDGFQFNLYRAGLGTGLAKFLGTQDLEVGDPLFDEAFVLQSNFEPKVRALFAGERIRDVLLAQPWGVQFAIQEREGRLESSDYPEGVHLLHFQAAGIVKDVDQLQSFFVLFTEVLKRLQQLDAEPLTEVSLPLRALQAPGGRITSDHLMIWDGDKTSAGEARRLGILKAKAAVPHLIAVLAEADLHLRANAAWALGEIGDPRAGWDLIPLLGDDFPADLPRVSFYAATALRQLGHGVVVDALAAVLRGGGNGMGTLRRYEGPELTEALVRLLYSPDSFRAAQSALALTEFGAVESLPHLRERLRALRRTAAPSHLEWITDAIQRLETQEKLPRPAAAPATNARELPLPSSEV